MNELGYQLIPAPERAAIKDSDHHPVDLAVHTMHLINVHGEEVEILRRDDEVYPHIPQIESHLVEAARHLFATVPLFAPVDVRRESDVVRRFADGVAQLVLFHGEKLRRERSLAI